MNIIDYNNILHSMLFRDTINDKPFNTKGKYLAHYTSIDVVKSIIVGNEIWFSNPMLMNDYQEIIYVLNRSIEYVENHAGIKSAINDDGMFIDFITRYRSEIDGYRSDYIFNTYIFCLSEIDPDNRDGLLSMWRAYGSSGSGAAIVFNLNNMSTSENSAVLVSEVLYQTDAERQSTINSYCDIIAQFISRYGANNIPTWFIALRLFYRIFVYSCISKNNGFSEEREWRFFLNPYLDLSHTYEKYVSYHIGKSGIEPKLKYKLGAPERDGGSSIEKIVHRIIIGPATAGELAARAFMRLLQVEGKPELVERVTLSSIPFRARP